MMVKRLIGRGRGGSGQAGIWFPFLLLFNLAAFVLLPSFSPPTAETFKAPIRKPSPPSAKKPVDDGKKSSAKPEASPATIFPDMETANRKPMDYAFEMKRVENLLRINDKNADAFFNRGWLNEYKGDFLTAEKDYSQAILLNNKHADAFYNRGLLFGKMKKFAEAVKDFTATIKLEPNAVDAYCNRANAYLQLGNTDLALEDYHAGLKIRPDDADLQYNRGVAYLVKGEQGKAIEDFRRAAQAGHLKAKQHLRRLGTK